MILAVQMIGDVENDALPELDRESVTNIHPSDEPTTSKSEEFLVDRMIAFSPYDKYKSDPSLTSLLSQV